MNLNLEHVRVPAGCPRSTPLAVLSRFAAAPQIDAKNGRYTACATAIVRVTVRRVSRVQNHGVCSPRVPPQLRDGVSHEDVGCGCSERQPSKSAAIENAKKVCVVAGLCGCVCVCVCVAGRARVCVTDAHTRATDAAPQSAVTDGRKRALRLFGPRLGNCLANKDHVRSVNATSQQMLQKKHARPSVTVVGTPCTTHDHSYPDLPMHCAWYRRRGSPLTSASVSMKRRRPRVGPARALAPVQQRPAIQTQLAPTA